MNSNVLKELYDVIQDRKDNPMEGSYTCYLFDQGLDKILKKCGEECSETIIAAKNMDNEELKCEISDLLYHVMVLCVQQGLPLEKIEEECSERAKKIGNLKKMKVVDRNT